MKKFGAIILVLALVLAVFPMTALAAGTLTCTFGTGSAAINGVTATATVVGEETPDDDLYEENENMTVTVTFSGTATNSGTLNVTLTGASTTFTPIDIPVAKGGTPTSKTFTFAMPDAAVDDLVLGMTFTESDALLSATDIVFDDEEEGYSRPAAKNIVIKNSGGKNATNVNATLISGAGDFDLVSTSNATIDGDSTFNSSTWTIQPVRRLLEGRYYATIRVAYNDGTVNKTLDIDVSFRVYDYYYYYGGGNLTNTITLTPSSNPYNGYGDLTLSSSGFYNHFQSLSLNGTRLTQGTDYTVENISGAARFTVFASTLQSLGSTTARFTAAFSSGSASTTVTIGTYIPDPVINPPKTGDASSLMGIGLIFMACALAVTVRKVRVRAK